MIATISPLRSSHGDHDIEGESLGRFDEFSNGFSGGTLLEDIDFDDLLVGYNDGDVLPDLEIDPAEIFAEFPIEPPESGTSTTVGDGQDKLLPEAVKKVEKGSDNGEEVTSALSAGKDTSTVSLSSSEASKGRKPSAVLAKSSNEKRKVKVDWTPELHRRFEQAVEQLGVYKAVPSRILEIMGIDCLTRHNIASHLQKYRSHRKHLLAREAEAASWTRRRQMYSGGGATVVPAKRDMNNPWHAPTMGFPPPAFRPLHVWGHPTVDQSLVHVWPKHLVRSPTPPPPWVPQPPPPAPLDPSYWHQHYPRGPGDGWVPSTLTQGTPCFPHPMPTARLPTAPLVPGVPRHALYRPNFGVPQPVPQPNKQHSFSQVQLDAHPSEESIDTAIGDVLAKPWLPLPLGLKPPSIDSVLVELQRQGISKIPPICS